MLGGIARINILWPRKTLGVIRGIPYLKLNPEALFGECWRQRQREEKNDEKQKENVQRKNNTSLYNLHSKMYPLLIFLSDVTCCSIVAITSTAS